MMDEGRVFGLVLLVCILSIGFLVVTENYKVDKVVDCYDDRGAVIEDLSCTKNVHESEVLTFIGPIIFVIAVSTALMLSMTIIIFTITYFKNKEEEDG